MKKLLLFSAISIIAFFSCQNVQENPEFLKLQHEKDSLAELSNLRGDEVMGFLGDLNSIQENLNEIKATENIITVNKGTGGELSVDTKEQIQNDINSIYEKMKENQEKLAKLKRKYKNANKKISALEKTIKLFEEQLKMKNDEINALNLQLAEMNIKVVELTTTIETLEAEGEEKDNVIVSKDDEINTVYYAIGTKKELIANNVITKEGGFIGLGKSSKLKGDFNKEYFTKADLRTLKEVSVFAKKATLITTNPESSYKFEGTGKVDKVIITNPEAFWQASKYLVIITE
jgi:seryl-tRNA synthetase